MRVSVYKGDRRKCVLSSADIGAAGNVGPILPPCSCPGVFLCYAIQTVVLRQPCSSGLPVRRARSCRRQGSAHQGAVGLTGHGSGSGAL